MKKKITLILCVVLALTMLCGCDQKVSLKKYQQLFADMGILRMDEVSPEITASKERYKDEVYHDEYEQKYMVDKEYSYSGFYVTDMDEEEAYQLYEKYVEYLLDEGFVCVNDGREGKAYDYAVMEKDDDLLRVDWYGIIQWKGYEGKCGMAVIVYK